MDLSYKVVMYSLFFFRNWLNVLFEKAQVLNKKRIGCTDGKLFWNVLF